MSTQATTTIRFLLGATVEAYAEVEAAVALPAWDPELSEEENREARDSALLAAARALDGDVVFAPDWGCRNHRRILVAEIPGTGETVYEDPGDEYYDD